MNKEVGILTFHSSNNFGALLQTYGTYSAVKKLGYNPSIINYHSPNKVNFYKTLHLSKNKSWKANITSIGNAPLKSAKKKKSDDFRKNILKVSNEKLVSFDELKLAQKNYAKIIVGSDQVWNYQNTGFDKRYLLDFIEDSRKKIAYAASFALLEIESKYKAEYARLLRGFAHLSVRETRGCELVKELTGLDAQQTIDPTLLLPAEEWSNFTPKKHLINDKYLLIYSVGNEKKTIEIAQKIAADEGLKVVIIGNRFQEFFISGVIGVNPNPHEYVRLFKDASYVVTSSFHGLVFSVIFNKQFTCCLDNKRAGNSRQISFLEMIGLLERLTYDLPDLEKVKHKIAWNKVNMILHTEKEKSISFLKNALAD